MVTIIRMRVVMYPAGPVVQEMCIYDQHHGGDQHPVGVGYIELAQHEKAETNVENDQWQKTVVVPAVSVPE